MSGIFSDASASSLRALAAAMRSGQLGPGLSRLSVSRVTQCPDGVLAELQRLAGEGMSLAHLAVLLEASADAAEARMQGASSIDLVWTGPEGQASSSRDTFVVVEELFANACRSVLVSGYAFHDGRRLFKALAERLDAVPECGVRLFLNIERRRGDTSDDEELVREFADRFRAREWPGRRMPLVYYDPRALDLDPSRRAVLHAKCIVVDDERALVTSANLTEAAQRRNIEAGVLVRDPNFARRLRGQFDGLVASKLLRRVPGLGEDR